MKNILAFTVALVIIQTAFSQGTKKEFLPAKGDVGTSLILNGLIDNVNLSSTNNALAQNILFVKYYLKKDLVLRTGLGFELENVKRESADSVGNILEEVDSLRRRSNFNLSVGIEKHLTTSNRLDPFIFAQLDVTGIGKTKIETETRSISSVGTETTSRDITVDGGVAFGLSVGGGFNYFVAKNFSVGSELFLSFQYANVGGGVSDNTTLTTAGGTRSATFQTREDVTKATGVGISPNAQINISYFF